MKLDRLGFRRLDDVYPDLKISRAASRFGLIPLILFAVYGVYFWFSNQEEVPITGREQVVSMSREEEAALGVQSFQQIMAQEDVVRQGDAADLVRSVGRRIAAAASDVDPGFNWEFVLIRSDQPNAFALPGGKTAVYTGILPIMQNEDGMAVVMGHEVAHAIARHGAERMALQHLTQLGTLAAGVSLGDMDRGQQQAIMAALGMGAAYGLQLPFSRKHESEADYMGLIFLARACFDPREAPELWRRMGQQGGASPAEWQSTHPSSETRIRQFQEWMPEALEIRRQHCG